MAPPFRPPLPPRNRPSTSKLEEKADHDSQLPERYRYEPIQQRQSRDGIRVLELLTPSSVDDSKIECKLHLVSLNDLVEQYDTEDDGLSPAPPFTALSYCWGDNVRDNFIHCNSSKIAITKNLAAILKYLSMSLNDKDNSASTNKVLLTRPRYLWIDAICINQDDLDERQQQVQLMPRIYTKAEKTLVWLGSNESDKTGECAARLLRAVVSMDHEYSEERWSLSNRWKGLQYSDGWEPKLKETLGADFELALEAAKDLYRSPWFSRAWIVQELALSRSIEVHFGNHLMNWQDIVDGARTFSLRGMLSSSPHLAAHVESANLPVLLNTIRDRYDKGYSMQLFDLLQSLRYRMATDSRDLVYSLLGLVSNRSFEQHGIEPNYQPEITAADVYLKVARVMLRIKRNLQLLECATMYNTSADTTNSLLSSTLPSWVPNWEVRGKEFPFLDHTSTTVFTAGGDVSPIFSIREDNRLVVEGITEVITKCSVLWPDAPGDYLTQSDRNRDREYLRDLEQLESFVTSASNFPSRYCTGESGVHVFLQTILMGQPISDIEKAQKQWTTMITMFRRNIKGTQNVERSQKSSYFGRKIPLYAKGLAQESYSIGQWVLRPGQLEEEKFSEMMGERRLAWSSQHALSLVPQATVPGDLLFIARGARLPFVIRPLPSGEYHLVGPAYTHGYMKGEAWTQERLEQVTEICLA